MPVRPNESASALSRRQFIKSSSLAAAVAAVSFPNVLRAQAKPPMNAVIIGVGGRGGGAGKNFLEAAKLAGVEGKVVAVADIFPEQAQRGSENFGLAADKCFSGFDAFQKALDVPGVNYAILASPPGFRPPHFKACIASGKHVFMEKPVAVDGPGCRIMYAAAEEAKTKGLKVAAGTQRRHQAGYIETIKRILPLTLRTAAKFLPKHEDELEECAKTCEAVIDVATALKAARKAKDVANAYAAAAYAAAAACNTARDVQCEMLLALLDERGIA